MKKLSNLYKPLKWKIK